MTNKPEKPVKRWLGTRATCDLCRVDISHQPFVDGRIMGGPWALMCVPCHRTDGMGLGPGRGQEYDAHGRKVGG